MFNFLLEDLLGEVFIIPARTLICLRPSFHAWALMSNPNPAPTCHSDNACTRRPSQRECWEWPVGQEVWLSFFLPSPLNAVIHTLSCMQYNVSSGHQPTAAQTALFYAQTLLRVPTDHKDSLVGFDCSPGINNTIRCSEDKGNAFCTPKSTRIQH